jgi:ribosomal protein S18 acetylase RimI-like enzyme
MVTIQRLRNASEAQFTDISLLESQLHDAERTYPREFLDSILQNDDVFLVAALDGEKIVGMGTVYVIQKLDNKAAFIEDVIVSEQYRGQGLGEKIMRALLELAKENGVRTVNLTSRPSRVAANALYQKLGFQLRETNTYKLKL